ncbi:MAG TPA: FlgD immunoglobulin-like domain containing protein [Steroidobacteraceae bacterium]|nr:FlgD immunoglobulin-like domain containing protein [Steroidobacteraceae bacterium]
MSTTTPVNTGTTGTGTTAGTGSSSLASAIPSNMQISQTDFLQLITTQMTNQDPLNPSDPTQFLSQIEGLSEVSSLQNMQSSMSTLASSLQASQVLSGTSLLGQQVLAPGSTGTLSSGGTVSGAVSAPSGATSLTVSITNASGALVDTFNVTPQSSGYTNFTWNGQSASGTAAAAGQYTIGVTANVAGATQSVSPLVYSTVSSVTIDPTTQALDLNTPNGTIPLSSVVSVQ